MNLNHNQIATTCRRILVRVGRLENDDRIPLKPWDHLIYDFASKYKDRHKRQTIRKLFWRKILRKKVLRLH